MLSIWLNVQGYIAKYIKVYLAPIRGSVTACIYGSLEVQAPVTPSLILYFSSYKPSLLNLQSVIVMETVLMGFMYKALKGWENLKITAKNVKENKSSIIY